MNYIIVGLFALGAVVLAVFLKDKSERLDTRGGSSGSTGARVKPDGSFGSTGARGNHGSTGAKVTPRGTHGSTGARITDDADPDDDMFGTRGGGHGSTGARVKPDGTHGSSGARGQSGSTGA